MLQNERKKRFMENENFEEIMKHLEELANELENGNLNLDESVKKFEEGNVLSKKCNEILEKAEKKITILINNGEDIEENNFKVD